MLPGIVSVALFTILVKNVTAISDEHKAQIQAKFLEQGAECLKEHPLSVDDINTFKEKKFPEGANAPCFTACVFKNIGFINDKGEFAHTEVLEKSKEYLTDDDDFKNAEEYLTTCSKVNNEEVTDGENGCERSKLAYNCLVEHADKFGFNIDF